jgi:hypothetical protein
MREITRALAFALAPVGALAACSDGTGVGAHNVALNFQVTSGAPAASAQAASPAGPAAVAGPPMVLVGSNGTLTIDEILLMVSEVELEAASGSCLGTDDSNDESGDGCEEFDAGPRFLDLPLDGQPIEVMTELVPSGTYDELEFEIEDLEDDEDDSVERAMVAAVRAQVLAAVPDWPDEASAMVSGSFAPTGGGAVDFRVFLKAEIEIEMQLSPSLVVDGGAASREVTVDIEPAIWFAGAGGAVIDLSAYDFDLTGQLLEFDVEFEDGFTKIEVEG